MVTRIPLTWLCDDVTTIDNKGRSTTLPAPIVTITQYLSLYRARFRSARNPEDRLHYHQLMRDLESALDWYEGIKDSRFGYL
jgi:hypothetical protein